MQRIARRQLLSLGALIFLGPALRLFPGQSASLAGRGAWLTPVIALPLALLYARVLAALLDLRRPGEHLPELMGRTAGRPALLLCTLWLLLYASFVLRAGADRFVGTVYPRAAWRVFAAVIGALSLAGALAGPRALARVGRMLLPFLLGALLLLLGIALGGFKTENLWPVNPAQLPGLLRGSLVPLDLMAGAAAVLCFPAASDGREEGTRRALSLWLLGLAALLTLLSAAVMGRFGHELTGELSRPFFVLVRTLRFFRTLERVEALVVMLWIFPDFLAASLFLLVGTDCLYCLLGEDGAARVGLKEKRPLIWLCGALVTALSLLIAPDAQSLDYWSQSLIPALNLVFCFALLPAVYVIARAKKK